MGIHHSPNIHTIPIPMGIPMGIPIPTAALEIFVRLLVIHHTNPCTKFEVSSSSSFGDMFDRMPKILGVT